MFNFNALFSRTKYIPRWSLMRQTRSEYLAEHTAEVMQLAHTIALIARDKFNKPVSAEKIVLCGLYHDISEILTGDMPTPVKYSNDNLKTAYRAMERKALDRLLETVEPTIRESITPYVTGQDLTCEEKAILKAADRIAALIKCIEEKRSGNSEFDLAYDSIYSSIVAMHLCEVDYFIENMLEGYSLCLDSLAKI